MIPTYRRPAGAAQAIESCLANPTDRLSVRCNSNGHEPVLEKFRRYDPRLTYGCFESNRGVHANLLHLFQSTTARFCMLLSDEDSIDPAAVTGFLDFLDQRAESTKVITSSIFDLQNNRFSVQPNARVAHLPLDLGAVLALSIVPKYLSGLVFSVRDLARIDLATLLAPSPGNAYPHLDIARHLLQDGFLRIYPSRFVLKGRDIHEGGDGYSHRKSAAANGRNPDLNPKIYGAYARTRQFCHSERILADLRPSLGATAYCAGQLWWFAFFANAVVRANEVVVADPKRSIGDEVELAIDEARRAGEFSGSFLARLFHPLITLPSFPRRIALKIVGKVVGLLQTLVTTAVIRGYGNRWPRNQRSADVAMRGA